MNKIDLGYYINTIALNNNLTHSEVVILNLLVYGLNNELGKYKNEQFDELCRVLTSLKEKEYLTKLIINGLAQEVTFRVDKLKCRNVFSRFVAGDVKEYKKDINKLALRLKEIYPSRGESGGRALNSHERTVIDRLKLMTKLYGDYSDEDIINATQSYIDVVKKRHYDKTLTLANFIYHKQNKESECANRCETQEDLGQIDDRDEFAEYAD